MRKRNRNVVYALMYGAGKKTATKIFLRNKQNQRMPARLRKKELGDILKLHFNEAMVQYRELSSKR